MAAIWLINAFLLGILVGLVHQEQLTIQFKRAVYPAYAGRGRGTVTAISMRRGAFA